MRAGRRGERAERDTGLDDCRPADGIDPLDPVQPLERDDQFARAGDGAPCEPAAPALGHDADPGSIAEGEDPRQRLGRGGPCHQAGIQVARIGPRIDARQAVGAGEARLADDLEELLRKVRREAHPAKV